MGKLDGKTAIVTGAGRNIGEAVAHALAREGARVGVVDLDQMLATSVAEAMNADRSGAALPIAADVSSAADVQRMVRVVTEHFGGVDVLVNNVAVTDHKNILDLEEEEWDWVMRVSLKSQFLCAKYVAKQMVEQGRGGRIINMASTSGHMGRPEATAYTAAKAAILNLTRSEAIQLAPYGIRVNSITPNQIGTPVGMDYVPDSRKVKNLVGRPGKPEDIAAAVVFLASADGDFMTAADVLVDGGALAGGSAFSTPPAAR
ncbi:MAG TPA: SDR family oxidoreductase [Chloroflexota bacterium]|nr:SDR family oxidoreductase [Chloroflexota bacterium]